MSGYIKRSEAISEAIEAADEWDGGYVTSRAELIATYLNEIPEADVRENKTGRWICYPECLKYPNALLDTEIVCSECKEVFNILDNDTERFYYCPCCGTKME